PILLSDSPIIQRTLGHDMESFFMVIIWIASLTYQDETIFLAKPLAVQLLAQNANRIQLAAAKGSWFYNQKKFVKAIIDHFEGGFYEDRRFKICILKLRTILYPIHTIDDEALLDPKDEETDSTDPMKKDLFRMCMKEIDGYLSETKGIEEMNYIDSL